MSSSAPPAAILPSRRGLVLVALFFVSGGASLVYETVWNRLLVLQMGNTAYALTTILTVFMGGLALGSVLGGRVASGLRDPLRAYGLLEISIGLYCAVVPRLIDALEPVMRAVYNGYSDSLATFSLFQFLACGSILLLPITAMGATLPIVADFVARTRSGVSTSVGLAYGINTLGGFVGVLAGGFVLIPQLGLAHSNLAAAALSTSAGLAAVALSRFYRGRGGASRQISLESALENTPLETGPTIAPSVLLGGLAASGFSAMTYQVAWTRALTLSIGSVTYSFPLIVGAFIGGLAVGSALLGSLADRPGRCTPLLILLQFGIAILAAMTIPALGELPIRMALTVLRYEDSFVSLEIAKFGAVFLIVSAPTFLMGGMLPLAVRSLTSRGSGAVGATLGRAYACNTFGTIAGAFVAGFVLIPAIGMQRSLVAGVAINAAVGGSFFLASGIMKPALRSIAAAACTLAVVAFAARFPSWDRAVITSAPYLHAGSYADSPDVGEETVRVSVRNRLPDIVYYREDVATTVTVTEQADHRYLLVGGKLDATDYNPTQAFLGHLPMLLHRHPERALVVGLGSSESLAAVLRYDTLQQVDCIEISPAVVEAAGRYFQQDLHPLEDPRVDLRLGDGRVHMAMTDRTYDVIVSQPGNPWMAGASALFTREYFEQMKSRLAPGGVVAVWVQAFWASPESVLALVGTFSSVFEHSDLWETQVRGDYILTGTTSPRDFDLATIDRRIKQPKLAAALARYGVLDAADLLGQFLTTGQLVSLLPGADRVNTDDHNFLELKLQRELRVSREFDVLSTLSRVRTSPVSRIADRSDPSQSALRERLDRIYRAKPIVLHAMEQLEKQRASAAAGDLYAANAARARFLMLLEDIKALNPREPFLHPM